MSNDDVQTPAETQVSGTDPKPSEAASTTVAEHTSEAAPVQEQPHGTQAGPEKAPPPVSEEAAEIHRVLHNLAAFLLRTEKNLESKERLKLMAIETKMSPNYPRNWNIDANRYLVLAIKTRRRMAKLHKALMQL